MHMIIIKPSLSHSYSGQQTTRQLTVLENSYIFNKLAGASLCQEPVMPLLISRQL